MKIRIAITFVVLGYLTIKSRNCCELFPQQLLSIYSKTSNRQPRTFLKPLIAKNQESCCHKLLSATFCKIYWSECFWSDFLRPGFWYFTEVCNGQWNISKLSEWFWLKTKVGFSTLNDANLFVRLILEILLTKLSSNRILDHTVKVKTIISQLPKYNCIVQLFAQFTTEAITANRLPW